MTTTRATWQTEYSNISFESENKRNIFNNQTFPIQLCYVKIVIEERKM